MLRRLLSVLAITLAFQASPSTAQTSPDATPPSTETGDLDGLIEALRDEATRSKLIEALEASVLSQAPVPDQSTEPMRPAAESTGRAHLPSIPGVPDPPSSRAGEDTFLPGPSIGDRVIEAAPNIATEFVDNLAADWQRLRQTFSRLADLRKIEPEPALQFLGDTLMLLVVSFGVLLGGLLLFRPAFRRIFELAKTATGGRRLVLSGFAVLLQIAILLVATIVTLALLAPDGGPEGPATYHHFYGVAFFFAGLLGIAIGAIFSPAAPTLRPVPMGDGTSRYWTWRLTIVFGLVTFGELFIGEAVLELGGPVTANGMTTAIHIAGAAYLAGLIIVNRKAPSAWVDSLAEQNPRDKALPLISVALRFWHWPALLIVGTLMQHAISTNEPMISDIARALSIIAATAVSLILISVLNRMARRGVSLPAPVARVIPNLEPRLASFIPAFLRFLRYLVIIGLVGFIFQRMGFRVPSDWLKDRYGLDVDSITISLIVIVVAGYAAWIAVTSWIDYRLSPLDGNEPTPREQTLFALLRNAAMVTILLVGLTYALGAFGVSVAPLLASAGVVGLAIGFGSQKLVQDIINGLFIQFESAISVGDVVELGGQMGTAEKLTIRSVSLRDVQGVLHIIPFSSVDSVSNHTMGYSYHVADISVAYGADLDAAKNEMLAAYDDLKDDYAWGSKLLGGIEWFGVQMLGDHSVVLRSRLKTRPGEQWGVGRAYAERVKRRFDAAGIEIPFPQMKLWYDSERPPKRTLGPLTPPRAPSNLSDADSDGDGEGR